MKKLIFAILILLLILGIYSCGKDDAASTATTAATDRPRPCSFILIRLALNMHITHIRLSTHVTARIHQDIHLPRSTVRQHMI